MRTVRAIVRVNCRYTWCYFFIRQVWLDYHMVHILVYSSSQRKVPIHAK